MSFTAQDLFALAIVALACAYVCRRGWTMLRQRRASNCGGGCGHCPAAKNEDGPALVTLEGFPPKNGQKGA